MKMIDMTGTKIGRLTVLKAVEAKQGRAMWLCKCDCGVEKPVSGKHLRSGQVVSCGCKKYEQRVSDEHREAVRRAYVARTKDKNREAQRKYREKNLEAIRADNRQRLAEYRNKNSGLGVLEAVTNVESFWSRVDIRGENECWEWRGAKSSKGYGVYAPLPGVLLRSHRVAYAVHNGEIDDSLYVCHACDNPPCCNPNHLFLGTPKDNAHDMIAKSRKVVRRGESNPASKLTGEQVRAIFQDDRRNRDIAKDYGVEASLVSMIRLRKIWVAETASLPDQPKRKTGTRPRLPNAQLVELTK